MANMGPFDNMDDIFNELMGGMNGFNSENKRYLINMKLFKIFF